MISRNMSPADLLDAHGDWLRRLARALVRGDRAAAQDLEQSVWEAALRSPPREDRPVRAWLGRVLINRMRADHRQEQRRLAREAAAAAVAPRADEAPSAEQLHELAQVQRRLLVALEALDGPFRQVLHMRYFQGLEPVEIARRLALPGGTVRWRLKAALDRIRAELDRGPDETAPRRSWRAVLALGWLGERASRSAPAPWMTAAAAVVALCGLALMGSGRCAEHGSSASAAIPADRSGESRPKVAAPRPAAAPSFSGDGPCPAAAELEATLAARTRELAARERPPEIFARSAPDPSPDGSVAAIYAAAMASRPRCGHQLECRGAICRVQMLVPRGEKVQDCFPLHPPGWPFQSSFTTGASIPVFDPVGGQSYTRWDVHYRLRTAPSPTAPPPLSAGLLAPRPTPAGLASGCRRRVEEVRQQVIQVETRLSRQVRTEEAFAAGAPRSDAETEVHAEVVRLLQTVDRASFTVECRGDLCAVRLRRGVDVGESWDLRLHQAAFRSPRVAPELVVRRNREKPTATFVRLLSDSARARTSSVMFVEATVRAMDRSGMLAACEGSFPGERGALEVLIRYHAPDDTGSREPPSAPFTIAHGGPLAGSPLGRCVMDRLEAFHATLEVPSLRNGYRFDTTLDFPGVRSWWGRRPRR